MLLHPDRLAVTVQLAGRSIELERTKLNALVFGMGLHGRANLSGQCSRGDLGRQWVHPVRGAAKRP